MRLHWIQCWLPFALCGSSAHAVVSAGPPRVTIIYDAFGNQSGLTRDWGFAALIEYDGKRILFDTGNNGEIFAQNVQALHIDLRDLAFAVISHRHGDHTAGLTYLLQINPHVKIYAPKEAFGIFGARLPGTFYRRDSSLAASRRYFGGDPPAEVTFGTAWPQAHFLWVDSLTEVAPGIAIISTVSQSPGTLELRELSLAIRTTKGLLLVVGCSHPGIETILQASTGFGDHVHAIFGGVHWVNLPDSAFARLATALHEQWKVDVMAPGHCTGEPAFSALARMFGEAYVYAGLGSVVEVN